AGDYLKADLLKLIRQITGSELKTGTLCVPYNKSRTSFPSRSNKNRGRILYDIDNLAVLNLVTAWLDSAVIVTAHKSPKSKLVSTFMENGLVVTVLKMERIALGCLVKLIIPAQRDVADQFYLFAGVYSPNHI